MACGATIVGYPTDRYSRNQAQDGGFPHRGAAQSHAIAWFLLVRALAHVSEETDEAARAPAIPPRARFRPRNHRFLLGDLFVKLETMVGGVELRRRPGRVSRGANGSLLIVVASYEFPVSNSLPILQGVLCVLGGSALTFGLWVPAARIRVYPWSVLTAKIALQCALPAPAGFRPTELVAAPCRCPETARRGRARRPARRLRAPACP